MARKWTFGVIGSVTVLMFVVGCGPQAAQQHQGANQPEGLTLGVGPGAYKVEPQPAAGSCHYRQASNGEPLPDPTCTPGATNPKVTAETMSSTICKPGYTKSIRPPVEITRQEKRLNAESYGYTDALGTAEYDHLISLELGGDPNDPRNLWVEPPDPGKASSVSNNNKDAVENRLHQLVCSGKVPLAQAQQSIATDWTTALPN